MDDRDAGSVVGVSDDEQRAWELAQKIFRSYDIQTRPKDIIGDVANLLLPLIRDQGRYRWLRERRDNFDVTTFDEDGDCWYGTFGIELDAAIDKARGKT